MVDVLLLTYGILHIVTLTLGYCLHQQHNNRHNQQEDIIREIKEDIEIIQRARN